MSCIFFCVFVATASDDDEDDDDDDDEDEDEDEDRMTKFKDGTDRNGKICSDCENLIGAFRKSCYFRCYHTKFGPFKKCRFEAISVSWSCAA